MHEAGGFCSQGFAVFHATDLTAGPHDREDTEADMVQAVVSEAEFRRDDRRRPDRRRADHCRLRAAAAAGLTAGAPALPVRWRRRAVDSERRRAGEIEPEQSWTSIRPSGRPEEARCPIPLPARRTAAAGAPPTGS